MQTIFDQVKIPQDIQAKIPQELQNKYFNNSISVESLEWIESPHGTLEKKLAIHQGKVNFYLHDFPELNLTHVVHQQLKNDWLLVAFLNPELSCEQLFECAHILKLPMSCLIENACIFGQVSFFNYLFDGFKECFDMAEVFKLSAYHGHSDILAFLISNVPKPNQYFASIINGASSNSKNSILTELFAYLTADEKRALIDPAATNLIINLIAHHNNALLIDLIESLPEDILFTLVKANDYHLLKIAYQHNNKTIIQKLSAIDNPMNGFEKFKYMINWIEIACIANHPDIIDEIWQQCNNQEYKILMTFSQYHFMPMACQHDSIEALKYLLDKHQTIFSQQNTQDLLLKLLKQTKKINVLKFIHGLIEPSKQNTCLLNLFKHQLFEPENIELLTWIISNTFFSDLQQILTENNYHLTMAIWMRYDEKLIALMLTFPKVFAFLDKNVLHERSLIETFAKAYSDQILYLMTYYPERGDEKLKDSEFLKSMFYIILHHIKNNTEASFTYVKQLLNIPEIKAIAHIGEEENQLLKAASKVLNYKAQACLLSISNVALTASSELLILETNGRISP